MDAFLTDLETDARYAMVESYGGYTTNMPLADLRDGKADWSPGALRAAANVYLDDFMLFDVSKPISDKSSGIRIPRSSPACTTPTLSSTLARRWADIKA